MNIDKLTKKELEDLGREHDIELDRRLSKKKLVETLSKALKQKATKKTVTKKVVEKSTEYTFNAEGILQKSGEVLQFESRAQAAEVLDKIEGGRLGLNGYTALWQITK